MKNRNLVFFISICLLVSLVATVPFVSSCAPSGSQEKIVVGGLVPKTGRLADYGPKMEESVKYAFSEIGYKISGSPVELILEDTATDPTICLDKAKKLVSVNKARVLLGEILGSNVVPLSKYAAEAQVPNCGGWRRWYTCRYCYPLGNV